MCIRDRGYFSAYDLSRMLAQAFGPSYDISWKDATNSLVINRFDGDSMHIWTDAEMASQKGNYNPQSFNAMLKNPDGAQINASSFTTLFVTTCPYDHIFLRSARLSGDRSYTTKGQNDVLCRIPINSGYQDVIVASTPLNQALELGAGTLSEADFRITDSSNRIVDLLEGSLSFQLTFYA